MSDKGNPEDFLDRAFLDKLDKKMEKAVNQRENDYFHEVAEKGAVFFLAGAALYGVGIVVGRFNETVINLQTMHSSAVANPAANVAPLADESEAIFEKTGALLQHTSIAMSLVGAGILLYGLYMAHKTGENA